MKKLIVIAGVLMAVYLAVVTVADARADQPPAASAAYEDTQENVWIIGAYGGRVAVFRGGELYLRTGTDLSSLPKSDRNRIGSGITVYSETELKRLLQDFCS